VSRRAYQVFRSSAGKTIITAFDLDTNERLSSLDLPYDALAGGPETLDAEHGRFFLVAVNGLTTTGLVVVDDASFAKGREPRAELVTATPHPAYASQFAVAGVRYEPKERKVLMALSPQRDIDGPKTLGLGRGREVYGTFVAQWTAEPGRAVVEGTPELVRECSSGPIGLEVDIAATPFFSADGKAVNLLCGTGETGWQFVQAPLDDNGKVTTPAVVVPAPSGIQRIVADPEGQRTHVFADYAYGATFDWTTLRLLGTFAVSPNQYSGAVQPGIDPQTGRVYILVPPSPGDATRQPDPGGLLLVDGRSYPIPQALAYREFVHTSTSGGPIRVDSFGKDGHPHVIVRPGGTVAEALDHWKVITDPVPISAIPDAALIDRTEDVDEVDGKTDRSFAGEASGYGSRLLIVGGLYKGDQSQHTGACGQANREVLFGTVQRTNLSSVGAAARADVLDADSGTRADAIDLGRCWPQYDPSNFPLWPPPPGPLREDSPGWDVDEAECSGSSDDSGSDPRNEHASATASCKFPSEKVVADSTYTATSFGAVAIGRSHNDTKLWRDPKRGIFSRSQSVVESVQLNGVGSIGLLRSTAETYAKGRKPKPGDPARAVWTVDVCGVRTASYEQEGCGDPAEAIRQLNDAGRGRVVFTRPSPDPDLLAGTAGGYLAAIQRDRGEASIALVEHGDQNLAIPGLEVQIRNSATTPGIHRYVVHLAAVRTVSVYGVSVIPTDLSGPQPPPPILEDPGITPPAPVISRSPTPPRPPAPPKSPVERTVGVIEKVAEIGWRVFHRTLTDAFVMAGFWWTFGLPSYLVIRRRRMTADIAP
jgi:hypothetical protein